jgi:hypothetical protein
MKSAFSNRVDCKLFQKLAVPRQLVVRKRRPCHGLVAPTGAAYEPQTLVIEVLHVRLVAEAGVQSHAERKHPAASHKVDQYYGTRISVAKYDGQLAPHANSTQCLGSVN